MRVAGFRHLQGCYFAVLVADFVFLRCVMQNSLSEALDTVVSLHKSRRTNV
jgi:hypothetical protein